jgi:hypothetical protein
VNPVGRCELVALRNLLPFAQVRGLLVEIEDGLETGTLVQLNIYLIFVLLKFVLLKFVLLKFVLLKLFY